MRLRLLPLRPLLVLLRKPGARCCAACICLLVAGCASIPSTATGLKAQCAPWRAITYSGKRDTPATTRQVRVHNLTGENLGCWK